MAIVYKIESREQDPRSGEVISLRVTYIDASGSEGANRVNIRTSEGKKGKKGYELIHPKTRKVVKNRALREPVVGQRE